MGQELYELFLTSARNGLSKPLDCSEGNIPIPVLRCLEVVRVCNEENIYSTCQSATQKQLLILLPNPLLSIPTVAVPDALVWESGRPLLS